jgi:hypothetical protein
LCRFLSEKQRQIHSDERAATSGLATRTRAREILATRLAALQHSMFVFLYGLCSWQALPNGDKLDHPFSLFRMLAKAGSFDRFHSLPHSEGE